ncbi:TPA: hypothetical protein QDB51_006090 [Burkholderia vietnamiensis]|nr:hypothetical protein [Burkholderia vietnamiensis]
MRYWNACRCAPGDRAAAIRTGEPGTRACPAATFNEVLNFMVNEMLETATLGGGCFWCNLATII